MVRTLSLLIIATGVLLLMIGVFQFFKQEQAQKSSLVEAYSLISAPKEIITSNQTKDTSSVKNESPVEVPFNPGLGEVVGILEIPAINAELPIVEGTDEDDLKKGVGHFKGTAYPTENDQIVLSGHRDTVFRRMGELEIGDYFIVKLPYGTFTYQIEESQIVDANDTSIIHSTAPQEVLIVSTCYPFSFFGDAPYRYVLTALPVQP